MYLKKLLLFLVLFLSFFTIIFAGSGEYTYTNGPWGYEFQATQDGSPYLILNGYVNDGTFSGNTGVADYGSLSSGQGRIFRYPTWTEDYTFQKGGFIFDNVDYDYTGTPRTFIPYRTGGTNELSSTCQPLGQSLSNPSGNIYRLSSSSSLQQVQTGSGPVQNLNNIENLLVPYYYMKNFAFVRIINDDTGQGETLVAFEDTDTNLYNFDLNGATTTRQQLQNVGGANNAIYNLAAAELTITNEYPVVLLDWTTRTYDLNLDSEINAFQSLCNGGDNTYCGRYSVQAFVVPVDGKCNVDNNAGFLAANTDFIADSTTPLTFDICPVGSPGYNTGTNQCDPAPTGPEIFTFESNTNRGPIDIDLDYQVWRYTLTPEDKIALDYIEYQDTNVPRTETRDFTRSGNDDQILFTYSSDTDDYSLWDYNISNPRNEPFARSFNLHHYRTNAQYAQGFELSDICRAKDFNLEQKSGNRYIITSSSSLVEIGHQGKQFESIRPLNQMLRDHYYMKALMFLHFDNLQGGPDHYFAYQNGNDEYYAHTLNSDLDGTWSQLDNMANPIIDGAIDAFLNENNESPFMLLNWSVREYTRDIDDEIFYLEDQCEVDEDYCGKYDIKAHIIPIDGKCNLAGTGFNPGNFGYLGKDGDLDFIWEQSPESYEITICPFGQEYEPGIGCRPDINLTGVIEEIDYFELDYANCELGPNGGLRFDGTLKDGDPKDISMIGPLGFTRAEPDFTSNKFFGFGVPPALVRGGTYTLEYNGDEIASCDVDEYWEYDQDETVLYEENLTDIGLVNETRYRLEENTSVDFFEIDDNNTIYFRENLTDVSLVPAQGVVPINSSKTITTYFEGNLVSQEQFDETKLALHLHKIKNLNNVTDAVDELNDISGVTSSYDITVNLSLNNYSSCYEGAYWTQEFDGSVPSNDGSFCFTNDSFKERTSVKIKLNGTPGTDIVVYQVIPKSVASSFDQIKFLNDGGGQRFVQDKDPIIGWYFNETDGSEEIEFEVPGNTSGGETIIGQEAILYNEGELVVNYRTSSCNADEAHLFDLEDLEDSRVFAPGESTYKVCVAHLTENLFNDSSANNSFNIMSYNESGNASTNMLAGFVENVTISVNDSSIYWGMKIQYSNPEGNYSCIGSINNEDNSLFGDCGYTNSKIWLHLGDDITPPESVLSYPVISHSILVTINSSDYGTGLKTIYYCIDDDDSCDPLTGVGVSGGDSISFTVTCDNAWGCIKFVRFQGEDNVGNIENVQSQGLKMLDQGSSCQADCTVKPSPNRYVAECNNLNSCNYYDYDDTGSYDNGVHVAGICDLLIEGSHARFNSTHDIQCPNGPFRMTRFVDESLDVDADDDSCPVLYTEVFPVLIEGESVLMKIISCII